MDSCVSDESKRWHGRNSITSLTDGGKLQVANPSEPDLTATCSCVEGEWYMKLLNYIKLLAGDVVLIEC